MKRKAPTAPPPELPVTPKYEPIGVCFFCIRPVEAINPGGTAIRHIETRVPYRQCGPANRALGRTSI